jgi:hypothetical protein
MKSTVCQTDRARINNGGVGKLGRGNDAEILDHGGLKNNELVDLV